MKYIKKTLLLLFITFIFFSSKAQLKYIDYHTVISKAENHILEKKYKEAFQLYDSVFKIYPKRFSKDLYNASICAARSNQSDNAAEYLMELSNYGYSPLIINKITFKSKNSTVKWRAFKRGYKKNLKKKFKERNQNNDYLFFEELFRRDQFFRMKKGSYSVYGDTINLIDSINMSELKQYILLNGYPTDKVLMPDFGSNSRLYIIVRHAYQNKDYTLSEMLFDEVKKGNLHPYIFAELEDKKYSSQKIGDKYCVLTYFKIEGKIIERKLNSDKIKDYNVNRASIGLESLEIYKKKQFYKFKIKIPFLFEKYEGLIQLSGIKLEDFNKFN